MENPLPTRRLSLLSCLGLAGALTAAGSAAAVEVKLLTAYAFEAGDASNDDSTPVQATPDGRYLALTSRATSLVAGFADGNHSTDALVLDRQSGLFEYVSIAAGIPARAGQSSSTALGISDDGRWVLFASASRDLIAGASYPAALADQQLYLFDRLARSSRLVSHAPGNSLQAANRAAAGIRLSADGRFVLFHSDATNLVSPSLASSTRQVYLYDRNSDTNTLVSRAATAPNTPGNGPSAAADLSADGRFALFGSTANNLIAGLTDGSGNDVFVYDRVADTLELISRRAGAPATTTGGTARDLSADGRFVLMDSLQTGAAAGVTDGNGGASTDVFVFDRQSGIARLASRSAASAATSANHVSTGYRLSNDGRFAFFTSRAFDLVSPFTDGNAENVDLYFFDAVTGSVTLASHAAADPARGANGRIEPMAAGYPVSEDGRYALFETLASDLQSGVTDTNEAWDLYLYDRFAGGSILVTRRGASLEAGGFSPVTAGLASSGGEAFFASVFPLDPAVADPHPQLDVFRFDAAGAALEMLTLAAAAGVAAWPQGWGFGGAMTPDGRHAAFSEFVWDRDGSGVPERVAHAAGDPATPPNRTAASGALSRGGRFVAFESSATDLVPGITDTNEVRDVFVYDRALETAFLASHAAGQPESTANSNSNLAFPGWISDDGNRLALTSRASNLVAGVTGPNTFADLYFHDRATGGTQLISHVHSSLTQRGGRGSGLEDASADGLYLVYSSANGGLVPGFVDANDYSENGVVTWVRDLYFYDRASRTSTLISHQPGLPSHGALEASPEGAVLTADNSAVFYALRKRFGGTTTVYRWDRASNTSAVLNDVGGAPLASCGDDAELDDVTPDGRLVLITTPCAFVPGDTNGAADAYLIDRQTGQKSLITHAAGNPASASGGSGEDISADGRRVVFRDLAGVPHSYDRGSRSALRLTSSHADPGVAIPASVAGASEDGGYVLVSTLRNGLVPEDDNRFADLFMILVADVFADGFESGSTARWSLTLP